MQRARGRLTETTETCVVRLTAAFQRIAQRRGKKIATTAVARKLLTRAWHLLAGAEDPTPASAAALNTGRGAGPGCARQSTCAGNAAHELLTEQPGPRMSRSWQPATRQAPHGCM